MEEVEQTKLSITTSEIHRETPLNNNFHLFIQRNHNFSLSYLDWQHHYSWAMAILPSRINATWIQALQYQNSQADKWNGYKVTNDVWAALSVYTVYMRCTKRWSMSRAGENDTGQNGT
jgi:hypothetical protein